MSIITRDCNRAPKGSNQGFPDCYASEASGMLLVQAQTLVAGVSGSTSAAFGPHTKSILHRQWLLDPASQPVYMVDFVQ